MRPLKPAVLRREMKTRYLNSILFVVLSNIVFAGTIDTQYEQAKSEFNVLKSFWEKEIPKYSSNTEDYWKGDAGKAILKMGKRALPFVFEEILKFNFLFNVAAEQITQIHPTGKAGYSEQTKDEFWIKWWHDNKNNPEWNIYLNQSSK
jgi:hypothetical protein